MDLKKFAQERVKQAGWASAARLAGRAGPAIARGAKTVGRYAGKALGPATNVLFAASMLEPWIRRKKPGKKPVRQRPMRKAAGQMDKNAWIGPVLMGAAKAAPYVLTAADIGMHFLSGKKKKPGMKLKTPMKRRLLKR